MDIYQFTPSELEDADDIIKTVILRALVAENLLTPELADNWCETHTIIRRKKSIFRTLSDKFFKSDSEKNIFHIIVVKSV